MIRETLITRIRQVFHDHMVEVGVDVESTQLTLRLLGAVNDWVKDAEDFCRTGNMFDECAALYDLRANWIGEANSDPEANSNPVVWVFQHPGMRKPAEVPGRWSIEQEARDALLRYFHQIAGGPGSTEGGSLEGYRVWRKDKQKTATT